MKAVRTILVPIDFSETSGAALDFAIGLAKQFGASIHLLHAYEAPMLELAPYNFAIPQSVWDDVREAARGQLDKRREKVAAEGVAVEVHLTHGLPSEAISATAEQIQADLIVMGTRGNTGLKHLLLGSVAERTLRSAPCPVLTVRKPG